MLLKLLRLNRTTMSIWRTINLHREEDLPKFNKTKNRKRNPPLLLRLLLHFRLHLVSPLSVQREVKSKLVNNINVRIIMKIRLLLKVQMKMIYLEEEEEERRPR